MSRHRTLLTKVAHGAITEELVWNLKKMIFFFFFFLGCRSEFILVAFAISLCRKHVLKAYQKDGRKNLCMA